MIRFLKHRPVWLRDVAIHVSREIRITVTSTVPYLFDKKTVGYVAIHLLQIDKLVIKVGAISEIDGCVIHTRPLSVIKTWMKWGVLDD